MAQEYFKVTALLFLLFAAACYDLEEKRIPNWILLYGMLMGLSLSSSPKEAAIKGIFLAVIFLLGMTGVTGMGDLKLWMMLVCILGGTQGSFVVALGSVLLLLHACFRDGPGSLRAPVYAAFRFYRNWTKIPTGNRHGEPFAVYFFFSYILLFFIMLASSCVGGK